MNDFNGHEIKKISYGLGKWAMNWVGLWNVSGLNMDLSTPKIKYSTRPIMAVKRLFIIGFGFGETFLGVYKKVKGAESKVRSSRISRSGVFSDVRECRVV